MRKTKKGLLALLLALLLCLSLFPASALAEEPAEDSAGEDINLPSPSEEPESSDDPVGADAPGGPEEGEDPSTWPDGLAQDDTEDDPTDADAETPRDAVSGQCGETLTWTLENGVLTITGSGAMTDWDRVSPWYSYRDSITAISLPEGLTSIGASAFYGCRGLSAVLLPESLTVIGDYAFFGCGGLSAMSIPEGVTVVGGHAFEDCYMMLSVEIPGTVTSIGDYAFNYCGSLQSVTLAEGLVSIGSYAFRWCLSLTELTIPASVTRVGTLPFAGDPLELISFGGTVDAWELLNPAYMRGVTRVLCSDGEADGEWDGTRCGRSLSWAMDGDGVLTISGSGDMWNYSPYREQPIIRRPWGSDESITTIRLDSGVTGIGSYAFGDPDEMAPSALTGLVSVELPDTLTSIGAGAFASCKALPAVTFPASVTEIGEYAFAFCDSLREIRFCGPAPSIDETCFFSWVPLPITAYYPAGDPSWTEAVRRDYGGSITWVAYEPEPDHEPGDINGDGSVNNKDVTRLLRYIKHHDVQAVEAALDVNGDGSVNNKDVTRLLRYLKHQDVEIR